MSLSSLALLFVYCKIESAALLFSHCRISSAITRSERGFQSELIVMRLKKDDVIQNNGKRHVFLKEGKKFTQRDQHTLIHKQMTHKVPVWITLTNHSLNELSESVKAVTESTSDSLIEPIKLVNWTTNWPQFDIQRNKCRTMCQQQGQTAISSFVFLINVYTSLRKNTQLQLNAEHSSEESGLSVWEDSGRGQLAWLKLDGYECVSTTPGAKFLGVSSKRCLVSIYLS